MHDTLWAPWRMQYLRELDTDDHDTGGGLDDFIAQAWSLSDADEANFVVYRNNHGLIMLNRYPYSNGHLLVALGEARGRLLDYDPPARSNFWALVDTATRLMHAALEPQGINTGINEGAAAGAGLPGHLHAHLVPRWFGDVNFMSTTSAARVIPASLEDMAEVYRQHVP
ncbi:MAG TPA: HIT domain-containing protein [Phycisphaerales bacterium]|nr:HIT domain-containing protein [Phycisphaerales bacterium]